MHTTLKLIGALGLLGGFVTFREFEQPILGLSIFTFAIFVLASSMIFLPPRVPAAPGSRGFRAAYRANRLIIWVGIACFSLFLLVVFARWPSPRLSGTLAICGIAVSVVALFVLRTNLRCPKCDQRFYGDESEDSRMGWNIFVRKCKHCGHRADAADA
jgi:hypothetical protein